MGAFQVNNSLCPEQWLLQRNQNIRSGSRVFVALHNNTTPKTAYSCFTDRYKKNPIQTYAPIKEFDTCVIRYDQAGLFYKYDARKLGGVSQEKPDQINVRFKIDMDVNYNLICLDMIRLSDIEHILTCGSFHTAEQMQLKHLFLAAKSAAHKESKANELALEFMQGVFLTIESKSIEAQQNSGIIESIFNDYRCAINGKEFNADVMRHQDIQESLTKLVKLRCCKVEQSELVQRIKTWAVQANFTGIQAINVTAMGQVWIQFIQDQDQYRAIFSTNQHGKSNMGKPKSIESDKSCFSYNIEFV